MARPRPTYTAVAPESSVELCSQGALTLEQAARYCGSKVNTLRAYIAAGEIVTLKIGSRRVVPKLALIRWLASKLEGA